MPKNEMPHGPSAAWSIGISILLVASILGILTYFDAGPYLLRLFAWLAAMGPWAPLLFILLDLLVVVLVLPGIMVTMGAGFLFGLFRGSLYVMIATTLGASLAFLIARHFLGARVRRYFLSHPRLRLINDEFVHEGWKVILLTRLIPFFPFKLSNYFFGLSEFRLVDFVLGTAFGILPFTVLNVYLGSMAADLSTLGLRHAARTKVEWLVYGCGFLVSIGAVIYLARHAKQALQRRVEGKK